MDKSDLSIEIDKGFLTVSGERKFEDNKESYHSIENGFESFPDHSNYLMILTSLR